MKRTFLVAALLLACVACKKKESKPQQQQASDEPSADKPTSAANRLPGFKPGAAVPRPANPFLREDPKYPYAKAVLTQGKIELFIKSMKENPLGFTFTQDGRMRALGDAPKNQADYDAYAQKYGFSAFDEYAAAWSHMLMAQTELMREANGPKFIETFEKNVRDAEAQLARSDLTPEQRQVQQKRMDANKKSIERLKNGSPSRLSKEELDLVRQYKPQIDEHLKPHRTATTAQRPPQ